MRVGWVKFVLVFIAVASSVGAQDGSGSGEEEIYDYGSAYYEEESGDYHYQEEEVDHCNLYETDDGEQCSHANFPEGDDIPRGAMRCCDGHRYEQEGIQFSL